MQVSISREHQINAINNPSLSTECNSSKSDANSLNNSLNPTLIDPLNYDHTYLPSILENHTRNYEEDPFYIIDINSIVKQYNKWRQNLPDFTPFYAVKCNNNSLIVKTLVDLGLSFDCASSEEIRFILSYGVPSDKIIFANPCKQVTFIKYARLNNVTKMTFDNYEELIKIKEHYPDAELVMRIHVDDSKSTCQLGAKFGVRLGNTKPLLEEALRLNLNVIGVSFHVGSDCHDANAYSDAIKRAKEVFDEGKEVGFNFNLLDIGGGFPGVSGKDNGVQVEFEDCAKVINNAMEEFFGEERRNLKLIAEPGRFFVTSGVTLITNVVAKRNMDYSNIMYYVNDGVYGSFNNLVYDHSLLPKPKFIIGSKFVKEAEGETHDSSLWGPTCDSFDCLSKSIKLPELNVGDWIIFENMGAYTLVASSRFNGMKKPKTYYVNCQTTVSVEKRIYFIPSDKEQIFFLVETDFDS